MPIESMIRISTNLPVEDAERLDAACRLAGITLSAWLRHVVFGDRVDPDLLPSDAAALRLLRDLSSTVLMVGAICRRSPSPTRRDQSAVVLGGIGDAISALHAVIASPYPQARPIGVPLGVVLGPKTRFRAVSMTVTATEAAAIQRSVTGKVSTWLRSVVDAGGMPAPATPNMQPIVAAALERHIVVVRGYGDAADPTQVADAVIRRGNEAERGLRMLATTKGVSGAPVDAEPVPAEVAS